MEKSINKKGEAAKSKQRLGEILVQSGLINEKQLQAVLKRQTQVGGQLGSILIEMGFITIDDLIEILSQKLGVPGVNLYKINIPSEILGLLPREKIISLKVLPIAADGTTVTLAMLNPQDFIAISEIEFMLGKKIRALVLPAFMMEAALKCLPDRHDKPLIGKNVAKMVKVHNGAVGEIPDLQSLLKSLMNSGASDILFTAGVAPSIRIDNVLKRLPLPSLTTTDCERYARELISYNDWDNFAKTNEFDFAVSFPGIGRFRVNVYKQRGSISIAMRSLVDDNPSFDSLYLPDWIKNFLLKPQGLILVCGPAGHGKTTTLSAMIDFINTHKKCNIVTLEDPIEILHKHKMSNINQREIGSDTESFAAGLRHVFRQAPDVIVIGEMRDRETFEIALQAAGTGHLVLSSIHADYSTSIFDRVINMFEQHRQNLIRTMLADCLLLVLSQRLIPRKNEAGRILAVEKLINTYKIKNLIKEKNTSHIRSQMQAGSESFESIDLAIAKLFNSGMIKFDDGLVFVEDEQYYRELTGRIKTPPKAGG